MSEDQRNAFSSVKEEDKNKSVSNSSRLDDKQKANVTYSNNVVMTKSPEENLTLGPDNTLISLCRDRPAEIGTGKEYTSAGAIYLCAGASNAISNKTPKDKNGVILKANRNFNLDASAIYMSANADIDEYFGLTAGYAGKASGTAAIAIKSTNVRVISRNSIKLITRTDVNNENNAPISNSINVIELIAGNDDSKLQPMVKGDFLVDGLTDLANRVFKIAETLEHFIKQQADFNAALAKHTHPDPINILFGLIAGGRPLAVTDGKTLEDIETKIQGELTTAFMVGSMLPDIQKHKLNISNFKNQYLSPAGSGYINSEYNRVN